MEELLRFERAQDIWLDKVQKELTNKKKESHWIWFIFPQLNGIGSSMVSNYFAIQDEKEARLYYKNKKLKKNLHACLNILYQYESKEEIEKCLGDLDTKKLHSSVSLFYIVTHKRIFKKFLDKFFNGILDDKTISLLKRGD